MLGLGANITLVLNWSRLKSYWASSDTRLVLPHVLIGQVLVRCWLVLSTSLVGSFFSSYSYLKVSDHYKYIIERCRY
jgi:hypothetical protein